jgi:hypothetical protein
LRLGLPLALALAAATPAHAAVITLSAADAQFNTTVDGSFKPGGFILGAVGLFPTAPNDPNVEDRYAFQFNLADAPAGATVTQATLRLRDSRGAATIFAYGFAGTAPSPRRA